MQSDINRRPIEDLLSGVPEETIEDFRLELLPFDRPHQLTTDLLRLDGKVAVVTGGGGAGLGNAICHRLAEQGAKVAVLDFNEDAAIRTAEELQTTWDAETFIQRADVADWESSHLAVSKVVAHFGMVDILVNNAGGSGSIGTQGQKVLHREFITEVKENLESMVGVNMRGALNVTHAALGPMIERGSGRIVNISSEAGKSGMPGNVTYGAAKAGVIGFTRNLAHEIGPKGIGIVAVCPGIMVTQRLLQTGRFKLEGALKAGFERSTIGRCSIPDEVASVVAFLASPAGSYIHGTAISVGGGQSD